MHASAYPPPQKKARRGWFRFFLIFAALFVGLATCGGVLALIGDGTGEPTGGALAPYPAVSAPGGASPGAVPDAPRGPSPNDINEDGTSLAPVPSTTPPPANSVKDGQREIGKKIAPGTWETDGLPGGTCIWTKSRTADGAYSEGDTGGGGEGPLSATFRAPGYVTFTGGCTWTKVS